MTVKINYIVKVADAKPSEIQKALETAGIKVYSVQETNKEEAAGPD
jgi:hypothetical protein